MLTMIGACVSRRPAPAIFALAQIARPAVGKLHQQASVRSSRATISKASSSMPAATGFCPVTSAGLRA